MARACRIVAAARRRGDGGFTLMMVLAALGVFSVLVVSMLAMVLADLRVQEVARTVPASARVIDGALEVAVNELKTSGGGQMGRTEQRCWSDDEPFEVTLDGVTVELVCSPRQPAGVSVTPVYTHGTGALTVLGGYSGPADVLERAVSPVENSANGISGVAPLREAMAANMPGLLHVGPEPLRVDGDVNVLRWALPYRGTAMGPRSSPALVATGAFRQGLVGPFGGLGLDIFGNHVQLTPGCGLLDPSFPLLPDVGVRVSAASMRCGDPAQADLSDPQWPPAVTWDAQQLAAAPHVVLPEECPVAGGVVTLTPGSYDTDATQILNRWFGPGSCDGVTFWFRPGDYRFDVAGGSFDAVTRGALLIDDPTSNWVLGEPLGWDPAEGPAPAAAFPKACDPDAEGVSITLSSRSTIHHRRGLAALCPRQNDDGTPKVLVSQEQMGEMVRWGAVPDAATSEPNGGYPAFGDLGNALASVQSGAAFFPPYGGPWVGSEGPDHAQRRYATATCSAAAQRCEPAITLEGFSNPAAPVFRGDVAAARLWIYGAPSSNVYAPGDIVCIPNCSATGVLIQYSGGGSCLLFQPDVPRGLYEVNVGLCRYQGLYDATQLDGATVKIVPILQKRPELCDFWILWQYYPCTPMSFSIDYAWFDVTVNAPAPPTSFSTQVNATVDETGGLVGNAITFYGPVHLPRSDVEINWQGGAPPDPIFAGGLVAKSVASWALHDSSQIGSLARASIRPAERHVLVLARVGDRLRGSAVVTISDRDGSVFRPGAHMQVDDWRLCNLPWDPDRRTPCPM